MIILQCGLSIHINEYKYTAKETVHLNVFLWRGCQTEKIFIFKLFSTNSKQYVCMFDLNQIECRSTQWLVSSTLGHNETEGSSSLPNNCKPYNVMSTYSSLSAKKIFLFFHFIVFDGNSLKLNELHICTKIMLKTILLNRKLLFEILSRNQKIPSVNYLSALYNPKISL